MICLCEAATLDDLMKALKLSVISALTNIVSFDHWIDIYLVTFTCVCELMREPSIFFY